jgi:hypothetical protein
MFDSEVWKMTLLNEPVAVWTTPAGKPERIVWRTRRFRVSDTPTRLSGVPELFWDPALTHPPACPAAWRFQGTTDDGETCVFDIRHDDRRGEWQVLRTYA